MDIAIIIIAAFGASMLTFFSGFGLGTILTPVFMLFFPIEVAIAMTGVVHLLNNIFKISLIGRHVILKVFLKFGLPAIAGAFLGASALIALSDLQRTLFSYSLFNKTLEITPVNLTISILMVLFGLVELVPKLKKLNFSKRYLIPGGLLSGFFGGLSGHQGALRTAFLVKLGLTKESFIATGIAISLLIDFTRIPLYYTRMLDTGSGDIRWSVIIIATLSAFGGAFLGRQLLKKITIDVIHTIVGTAIIVLGIGLGLGFLS
jgi:hypothetical protein